MANWHTWRHAFDRVLLREEGDDIEIDGCRRFSLDSKFPNHQAFWRLHVVPVTCRPGSPYRFRRFHDPIVANMATTNHGIFCDLVTAEECLSLVKQGDFGPRYQNCLQSLKAGGDAMQKLDDLQRELIQDQLAKKLGRTLCVWTKAQWQQTWRDRYNKLVAYRNYLTHVNMPQVMVVSPPNRPQIHLVPHEDHFLNYESRSWSEQTARYQTHPVEWDALGEVCERVHEATITWLNDVYAEILKILEPLLTDEDYHHLWGWDTTKHGRQDSRDSSVSPGAQAPVAGISGGTSPAPRAVPPSTINISARTS
jgi:hypothetical protein